MSTLLEEILDVDAESRRPGAARAGEALLDRQNAAVEAYLRLDDAEDPSTGHQRLVALAGAKAWRLRALVLQQAADYDAARKASSTADELAKLAARLERNTLADRVALLERKVLDQRVAGARLQALAHTRRK